MKPSRHLNQNFHIFTNIFNQHFYETRSNPNKLFEGRLNVFTALGQHAGGIGPALGRQSVLQVTRCVLSCPDYKTPISGDCSDLTVCYVAICHVKYGILLTCFVYMAIYDLEIQLDYITIFRYFKLFFDFFVFLVKISRLYSFK